MGPASLERSHPHAAVSAARVRSLAAMLALVAGSLLGFSLGCSSHPKAPHAPHAATTFSASDVELRDSGTKSLPSAPAARAAKSDDSAVWLDEASDDSPDARGGTFEAATRRRRRRHPTGTPEPKQPPALTGQRCLSELTAQHVRFRALDERPGIETPIIVKSPIAGVTYFAQGIELLVDCRLALTLVKIAPLFSKHGVTRVRFSGAYVYRLTRHGKMSLHANGLALDVHAITVSGKQLLVQEEFVRGLGCGAGIPLVNQLACELRATELFREVITPDYDADHKDHVHIAIPRLATTPSTLVAAEVPGSLPEAIPEVPPEKQPSDGKRSDVAAVSTASPGEQRSDLP